MDEVRGGAEGLVLVLNTAPQTSTEWSCSTTEEVPPFSPPAATQSASSWKVPSDRSALSPCSTTVRMRKIFQRSWGIECGLVGSSNPCRHFIRFVHLLQVVLLCGRITCVEFGGSVKETNLICCRWSTPERSQRASVSGQWSSGRSKASSGKLSNWGKGVEVMSSMLRVVSPHILGEVLVASESGAANLWTVGKGWGRFSFFKWGSS